MEPLLEMRGIVKRFGSATVNDHVNLTVYPGEVHALLGENGAGKSTLMNILYGMYQPNEGMIRVRGKEVEITSPKVSLAAGIGMVHQNFMLVDTFTSAENVFLMADRPFWSLTRKGQVAGELTKLSEQYGIEVDLTSPVSKLSIGMQQRVEILKLLYIGADILIFDEPTAVLAPQECDALFEIIKKLVANQKSVIFISHKLEEVLRISDRITVLSRGRVVEDTANENLDQAKIVEMMIGEAFRTENVEKTHQTRQEVVLSIEDVCAADSRGVQTLNHVTLQVRRGEILGIAGLEGNGQDELMDVITGLRRCSAGRIAMAGKNLTAASGETFVREGVGYVPSDRNNVATVRKFCLYDNWLLRRKQRETGHYLHYRKIIRDTEEAIAAFDVRTSGSDAVTENLSGGNLQKFILGRELSKEPKLLACSNPTRGIDVKASWAIRNRILQAKEDGMAVVLASGDFEELLYLSDRILVLYKGMIFAETTPEQTTVNQLGSMMMGVKPV
ncbi:simple sugar transport system ATP-binding protein [Oscillibacter sp. PC13]|uniref:ABC transporter ATP-binding protein n=1 Tax=Oscillibacter sp. PC13 TaxID=1855299 RepID=UPI0008ED2E77|nr:ABC transporter ATP-binding protein [Oscillibacter sp. PC13]SFQ10152.1 simple sugar transport system ATP-binding protein [Oscillibacter sp. PC13]